MTQTLDWDTDAPANQYRQRWHEREEKRGPTAEEIAETEAHRKTRRDYIKQGIARGALLRQKCDEQTRQVASINERKESLAAEHVETCAPIQERLKFVEQLLIEEIAGRAKNDPSLTKERNELLAQLAERNSMLSAKIAGEDRLLATIETERYTTGHEAAKSATESDLLESDVVRPDLYQHLRTAEAVHAHLAAWAKSLREYGQNGEAQLVLVQPYHDDAERAKDAAFRACVDE